MKDNYWTSGKFIWFSYCQQLNNSHKGFAGVALSVLLSVITTVTPMDTDVWELCGGACYRYIFSVLKGFWHYPAVLFLNLRSCCWTTFATGVSPAFCQLVTRGVQQHGWCAGAGGVELFSGCWSNWPSQSARESCLPQVSDRQPCLDMCKFVCRDF